MQNKVARVQWHVHIHTVWRSILALAYTCARSDSNEGPHVKHSRKAHLGSRYYEYRAAQHVHPRITWRHAHHAHMTHAHDARIICMTSPACAFHSYTRDPSRHPNTDRHRLKQVWLTGKVSAEVPRRGTTWRRVEEEIEIIFAGRTHKLAKANTLKGREQEHATARAACQHW